MRFSIPSPRLLLAALLLPAGPLTAEIGSRQLAGMDLLDVPALHSDKAAHSVLLGLAQVGSRLVAVGERGIVVHSDDDGAHWTQADVPVSVTLTSVTFTSPQVGWAAGHDGVILRSDDAGASWRRVIDGNTINTLVIDDLSERVAVFEAGMADDDDQALEQFEQLQFTLEDAEAGASFGPTRPILDLWFDEASTGYAIGAFGQLLRTRDGGASWQSLTGRVGNPESLHFNSIGRVDGLGLVIAGERGLLWASADDGEQWTLFDTGYHGHLYGLVRAGGGHLLAYGFAGSLLRSDDEGATWTALPRLTDKALVSHAQDAAGRLELVSRSGQVFISRDGGESFDAPVALPLAAVSAVLPLTDRRLAAVGVGGVVVANPTP